MTAKDAKSSLTLGNVTDTFEFDVTIHNLSNQEKSVRYETTLQTDQVQDGKFTLHPRLLETLGGKESITKMCIRDSSYLDGSYTELNPNIPQNEEGFKHLCKIFSFPGGIASHAAPETPGSIHEGGELGYALSHAAGAVLDNPDVIAATVIGDGAVSYTHLDVYKRQVFRCVFYQLESRFLNAFFIPNECKDAAVVASIRRVV